MRKFYVIQEELRTVLRTLKSIDKTVYLTECFENEWMSQDRLKQYSRLRVCLSDKKNQELIVDSLIQDAESNFAMVAGEVLLYSLLSNTMFIAAISGLSLTNRILKACEDEKVSASLAYRLKQCAWIYQTTVG